MFFYVDLSDQQALKENEERNRYKALIDKVFLLTPYLLSIPYTFVTIIRRACSAF